MKQTVYREDFTRAFHDYNRSGNFTPRGLVALYNYFEQLEEDTGEEIELDVIAICVEFTEYETLEEALSNYTHLESMEDLEDATTVIMIDDQSFIIQDF